MTQQSITPSPELIKDWHDEWNESDQIVHSAYTHIAIRAAQWGADQELEACCALLEVSDKNARDFLQSARRPKPPSLKEQALQEMDKLDAMWDVTSIEDKSLDTIRRALEQLPDHE